jgi:hypothetical protein
MKLPRQREREAPPPAASEMLKEDKFYEVNQSEDAGDVARRCSARRQGVGVCVGAYCPAKRPSLTE